MNLLRRWLQRHDAEPVDEGRAAVARADQRADQVAELGAELAAIQARNHFSAMVQVAIARPRPGPATKEV